MAVSLWEAPAVAAPLNATVSLPGSKSLTARSLLLAALATEPTILQGVLRSRDTDLMIAALRSLGTQFTQLEDSTHLRVTPTARPFTGGTAVDCGLAGTVMRFVPCLAALADSPVTFDGDEAARLRPLGPLLDALTALGVSVEYLGEKGFLPVRVGPPADGAPLHAAVTVDAAGSSQFLSALLLLGAALPQGLRVTPAGPVPSLPHVAMTVESLRERGVDVVEPDWEAPAGQRTWQVLPGTVSGGEQAIEPDLSNAGPFLASALVAGGSVGVPNWPASTTQAGDAWRWLLPQLGGTVSVADGVFTASGSGVLRGLQADLSAVGELAPTVAALAALAAHQGHSSELTGIAHLRGHETNRLAALVAEINRLGGDAAETADGLVIRPARLHGAQLRTYGDHRMATFAAVIGLAVPGVRVEDVECTSKTLPDFPGMWRDMLESR